MIRHDMMQTVQMRKGKLIGILLYSIGIALPLLVAFWPMILGRFELPQSGVTNYGPVKFVPDSPVGTVADPRGINLAALMVASNILLVAGFVFRTRSIEGLMRGISTALIVGSLLVPVAILTLAYNHVAIDGPRRYHYYYFASQPSLLEAFWIPFPGEVLLFIRVYLVSLVLIGLGQFCFARTEPASSV